MSGCVIVKKSRSVGMSTLTGDELSFWVKEARIMQRLFTKPRQLGMSSYMDPDGVIKWNIKKIEEEVFARGGRYQVSQ